MVGVGEEGLPVRCNGHIYLAAAERPVWWRPAADAPLDLHPWTRSGSIGGEAPTDYSIA